MMTVLVRLVDAGKLAGWVRAAVAALFGYLAGVLGGALVPFLTPEMQNAVGLIASTIVVGVWSQLAKKYGGTS